MTKVAQRREDIDRIEKPAERQRDDEPIGDVLRAVDDPASLAAEVESDWAPTVSTDRADEAEADRVADAAVQHVDAKEAPVVDGALTPAMQGAMRQAAPGVEGLGDVKFDESAKASAEADSIDALAFTRGNDVSVARGEMTPHLAAHEATHAVAHSSAGADVVHAKLRGTSAALQSTGGEQTTKGIRKKIGAKTNWDKIVDGVSAYEQLETTLLQGGANPSVEVLKAAKPKMIKTLKGVESSIKAWEKANNQSGEDKKTKKKEAKSKETLEQDTVDDRAKAERRQVIGMLKPRVATELSALESKDSQAWIKSLGLDSSKVTEVGREDGGQKNKVKELTYQTESGEFAGYFKQDKGFAGEQESHEVISGISQVDPNFGARSVAMYKIDQLLGAGVIARAEFATHVDSNGKTVLGTVLESAKGTEAGKTTFGMNKEHAKQVGGVALDDPVLQKSLNKMQILDAICGQLDRHAGNYYIQTDGQGNVTGVTGIDLDMAFGKDMDSPESRTGAHNYRGMPAVVDAEFGRALLKIAPDLIRQALTGLLPPAEVTAAVKRFTWVQDKVRELNTSGKLKETWDESTLFEGSGVESYSKTNFSSSKKSYQDDLLSKASGQMEKQIRETIVEIGETGHGPRPFNGSLWRQTDDWPAETKAVFADLLGRAGGPADAIAAFCYNQKVGDQLVEIAMTALNDLLRDDSTISRFVVDVQEQGPGAVKSGTWGTGFKQLIASMLPGVAEKVAKKVKPSQSGGRQSLLGSRGKK